MRTFLLIALLAQLATTGCASTVAAPDEQRPAPPGTTIPSAAPSASSTSVSAAPASAPHVEVDVLDDPAAVKALETALPELGACYAAELREDPETSIEWAGGFDTDPSGRVTQVDLFAGFHPALLECITGVVQAIKHAPSSARSKKTFVVRMWTGDKRPN